MCVYVILKDKKSGKEFTFMNTHFGFGDSGQIKSANLIFDYAKKISDLQTLIVGDFNMTPDNPILAPIKARMKDTAEAFGEEKFSFPSDTPDRKIDYIFVSSDAKVLTADIPAIVASDHRPHIATVEF